MAKLKARGRQEIARLVKENDLPEDRSFSHEKKQVALMSDGNVLKRRVLRWRDEHAPHDYGWKVAGKIKAGLTPEDFIAAYLKTGYALESASPNYIVRRGNTIENLSGKPVVTEAKAAQAKKAKVARAARPKNPAKSDPRDVVNYKGEKKGDGPGYYITNRYVGTSFISGQRAAELGPFDNLDLAEDAAWARYNEFRSMSFDYLLPVKIIRATSRHKAENDEGHTWWIDGKRKGPPVDPRQAKFNF
jgi:hypothetical protein